MAKHIEKAFDDQVEAIREKLETDGLPFADLLHPDDIHLILEELQLEFRDRIYTPDVVVRMFILQALSEDASCSNAVAKLIADRAANQQKACSPNTGSYCTARSRLPEELLRQLARRIGPRLQHDSSAQWQWKGRDVKVVDGTTVSMPDTPTNQAAFPQPKTQKPGVGYPLARLVVVFSLATATAIDMAIGPYQGKQTGENALFRSLWHGALQEGEVVTGDRYYGSYADIAMLQQRGVDVVFRKHQLRGTDFRRGQRLGKDDHIVTWRKPKQRPTWMDAETFAGLPDELRLREVRIKVTDKKKRVKELIIVTTLLDADQYTKEDLAQLYRQRWNVELDLRSIKSTLKMDVLRSKSPDMVRKEVWVHLLAYNLIRLKIAQAGWVTGRAPRSISFKGAVQAFKAFQSKGLAAGCDALTEAILLATIAYHEVGNRPNRYEPRQVRRRPKPHKLLNEPRNVARRRGPKRT